MKIHHIGYLVSDMEKAIKQFEELGGTIESPAVYDEARQIDIAFIQMGAYLLELVYPHETSRAVGKALKKMKNTPYHLCYECDDIYGTIDGFVKEGCIIVEDPEEAVAIQNKKVAFLYSSVLGLFELLETFSV